MVTLIMYDSNEWLENLMTFFANFGTELVLPILGSFVPHMAKNGEKLRNNRFSAASFFADRKQEYTKQKNSRGC